MKSRIKHHEKEDKGMKKRLCLLLCITVAISLFAGCSGKVLPSGINNSFDKAKINTDLVEGNSRFAFNVFRQLNKEDEGQSIFISPLSISTALSMTYLGAKTTTKESMAKALEYTGIDDEILKDSYSNLTRYLRQLDKKIELNISNSLWIREGEVIKEDFTAANKKIFDASVNYQDFSDENAANIINQWISDATKKKIEKMLDPPISSDIVMYLINAIYFKGDWTNKFDKKYTFDSKFSAGNGSQPQVSMMSKNGKTEFGQGDGYKAVRLPYGNGKTAMYCILPEENVPINQFIAELDEKKWKDIRSSISEKDEVVLQLPRFKLEYGIKNLNESKSTVHCRINSANLKYLGMNHTRSKYFNPAFILTDPAAFASARPARYVNLCTGLCKRKMMRPQPYFCILTEQTPCE